MQNCSQRKFLCTRSLWGSLLGGELAAGVLISAVLLYLKLMDQVCQISRSDGAPIAAYQRGCGRAWAEDAHLDVDDYKTEISYMFLTQCGNWHVCYEACAWNIATISVLTHIFWKTDLHSLSLQAELERFTQRLENGCCMFASTLSGNFLEIGGFIPKFPWANHDSRSRN